MLICTFLIGLSLLFSGKNNCPKYPNQAQESLRRLWCQAKDSYPYWDFISIDEWDIYYSEALNKATKIKDDYDYLTTLEWLGAKLNDGHFSVTWPKNAAIGMLNIKLMYLDGQYYVIGKVVADDTIGISCLDRLTEINGMQADAYFKNYIQPLVATSFNKDFSCQAVANRFCFGRLGECVQLLFTKEGGETYQKKLLYMPTGRKPDVTLSLPQNVYYHSENYLIYTCDDIPIIKIYNFKNKAMIEEFKENILPILAQYDGTIVDLRGNGGGNSTYGLSVMSYLVPRVENIYFEQVEIEKNMFCPCHCKAILIDCNTASAAEFISAAAQDIGIPLIGEPTAGVNGTVLSIDLADDWSCSFTSQRVYLPDGRLYLNGGVFPNYYVKMRYDDIIMKRDMIVEKALKIMKGV